MCCDGIRFLMVYCGLKEPKVPDHIQASIQQHNIQTQNQNQEVIVIVAAPQPSHHPLEMYNYGYLNDNIVNE